MKTKTLFLGTSVFAIEIVKSIIKSRDLDLIAVVTQPDRPFGRKKVITPSPVKSFFIQENIDIEIFQPEKIKLDYKNILEKVKPELIIVAAYGQILPEELLEYPTYGALNFHGSILPDLRGAVPIQTALLKGYRKTGVTLQKMVKKMDAGDIIAIRTSDINKEDDYISLEKRLSILSAEIVNNELQKYLQGKITPIKQEESQATYCYIKDITFDSAEIKFNDGVGLAINKVKAFVKSPVAWIRLENRKILKIYRAAEFLKYKGVMLNSLKIYKTKDKRIVLTLNDGIVELLDVQLEGKSRALAKEYLYLADDYIN